ncbi:hypothetical protein BXZ70DRAFT_903410 [Cristinia sonorae]|uniref:Uncharacterized protein n=1 Tax=Cristinia sonorae TaxID=1940300 RepID=A0A8K0V245_9AGAR|nr:hypothetical protein BXZ70DRAFT_903410 [Cristinia sonorae]
MSDEYGAVSGFKGSLVNKSAGSQVDDNFNYKTGNYPPENDSTSSGGYGSPTNIWSDRAQRGRAEDTSNNGLIDQSTNGSSLSGKVEDAKQGQDEWTRRDFDHESKRDFSVGTGKERAAALDPYGADSFESKKEAEDMLAKRYREARC